jgi:C4-dicarboxylate-specific signal transduction histidine kinase
MVDPCTLSKAASECTAQHYNLGTYDALHPLDAITQSRRYSNYQAPDSFIGNHYTFRPISRSPVLAKLAAFTPSEQQQVSPDIEDDQAVVQISDTGLEERNMADLQEPFMTTKPSGMGLGLTVSVQIVKYMNGRIEARETGKGGAEFILWLPLSKNKS